MRALKLVVAAALALCAALALAAESDPPAVVGRLSYLSGSVSFAPAQENEDWVAATLNRPVTTGDRLWTDANGRAELHVGSLAVRMAPQTSMDVLNLDERTLQLRVAQGAVNLRVRRLASDKTLEIATPGGAVVVKQPGSYRVSVDASGNSTLAAVRLGGQAEVFTGNSTFTIRDNQEAELSGGRPALYAASAPDDFDQWTAERDRREERVASTRYVPEEMTGYEDLDAYGAWSTVPEYGAVWVPRAVPTGWAPYRDGHWVWISPWGWTWVDDAPWGFAPFHYGRWVWFGNHWAWAPGQRVARPVYAPAMVAFIGGANFSVSFSSGSAPAVGWVPLGWHEPYRPWYHASPTYVRNVNVTHVTNVTNITNITNVRLANRSAPSGVTVVSRENFIGARRVQQAAVNVPARQLAAAPVTQGAPVAAPVRASFAAANPGSRPPAAVTAREAVAVNTPAAPRREVVREDRQGPRSAGNEERPRVRVINRQERVSLPVGESPRARAPAAAAQQQPTPQPQAKGAPSQQQAERRAPEPRPAPQQSPQQAERRVPAPPAEISRRPTFDKDMHASTPESRREQRPAERQHAPAGSPQAAPQPDARAAAPRPAPEAQRPSQQEQGREQQARERETRQREFQRQQEERQREQQQRSQGEQQQRQQQAAQEREQQTRQREAQRQQQEEQQRAQQAARQQEAQRQQAEQQRAQQAARQQEQRQQQAAAEQARQRDAQRQQQEQQRAQQLAQQQAQQQAAQQRAQQQAQQQAAQQRAQQQAQQQAAQQRAQQQAQQQAQARRQEAQREQVAQQRAPQQAHERDKGAKERPRAEKSDGG